MWEGSEDAEVREGRIDWGEGGLASEGADKQEDKSEEEVAQARVPHLGVGAVVGNMLEGGPEEREDDEVS